MRLSPEVNLLAFTHYVQALEYQRKALQVVGILGSKTPHIQNLTVGGVANAIDLDSASALNMDRLEMIRVLLTSVVRLSTRCISSTVLRGRRDVSRMVQDWQGRKPITWPFPDLPPDSAGSAYDLPGGIIMNGNIAGVHPFKTAGGQGFREAVTEDVAHAYYQAGSLSIRGSEKPSPPSLGGWRTKYSWVKAPRFNGQPMQVGPTGAGARRLRRKVIR